MDNTSNNKSAVLVMSSSSIDYLPITKPDNLFVLRYHIMLNDKMRTDADDLKAQEFYRWMVDNHHEVPKPLLSDFNEISQTLLDIMNKGFERVLVISLCRNLSDQYYAVKEVVGIIQNRIEVELYDTETFSIGEVLFGLRAAEMFREGKSMAEVVNHLDDIKRNTAVYFLLDTLHYLSKNGRLSRVSNFTSAILRIKPMFRHRNGVLEVINKVRKTDRALKEFGDFMTDELAKKDTWGLGIYCGNHQLYDDFMRNVSGDIKGTVPLSPVVGCHFGPNSVGMAVHYNTGEYLPEGYQLIK